MKKRVYKGREVDININESKLIKQTNKLIEEANKRLIRLTKGIDINKSTYDPRKKKFVRASKEVKRLSYQFDSWSAKKMFTKLRIDPGLLKKVDKQNTYSEIMLTKKAVQRFLNSKTSTISGIREVVKNTKDTIRSKLEDFDTDEVDDNEIEVLNNFWYDSDYAYVTQYIDPSELWIALDTVSNAGGTVEDFLHYIERYIYSETLYKDQDLVDALTRIYEKFTRSMNK